MLFRSTYLCKGIAGFSVDVTYWGNYVTATFRRGGKKNEGGGLGAQYSVGDKIEWRGVRSGRTFEPRAAILRLRSRDENGKLGEALGVVRIDGDTTCPVAIIDAGANRNANELARKAADGSAALSCAGISIAIVGVATERAKNHLERSGR